MIRRTSLPLLAWALLLVGCAQEQPTIDRVQPNVLDKAFFIGQDFAETADDPEFYSLGTLVDVGFGTGSEGLFTSSYAQPLTRVKWSVQEELLVARLAYERVSNTDGKGAGRATNDGIVVAAYRITKHFDVKRQYNPSTGEQLNVVEENDVDRPWHQRQFMRVDWSKNLSVDNYDYDTLAQIGVYDAVAYEPLAYTVNDPSHPDAPHFDSKAGYLDVTNKAWAKPQTVDLSDWGGGVQPACYFDSDNGGGTAPESGCAPVELTIRQAFLKVTDNDYEPTDWDGYRFQAFGAFTVDRYGYSRNYGMTDSNWHRFIARYNLWKRSHAYADAEKMTGATACFTPTTTPRGADPHRDLNHDGTEDECAAVGKGSRCDTFKQRCTLPFRDREVKPIVWYYSGGSTPGYFDATRRAANEWDTAVRGAVLGARSAECRRTGGQGCDAQFPMYSGQQEENLDAVNLTTEVDDCRQGLAYAGEDCNAVADRVGAARGYSAGVIALAKQPEVLVLCHSPVEAADPQACGGPRLPADVTAAQCDQAAIDHDKPLLETCAKALNVRRGDIRYHQVNAIAIPQSPSPWGIMVDANDPLSGETVAASINVWTHVNDLWSQALVDMARYAKGELTTAEVTEGTNVQDWAAAAEAASKLGSLPKLTADQHEQLLASMLSKTVAEVQRSRERLKSPGASQRLEAVRRSLRTVKAAASGPTSTRPAYEARRRRALGTATEAALTTKMMQSYAGPHASRAGQGLLELASPLRGANPALRRELKHAKRAALAARGACIMDDSDAPAPLALTNLADLLQEKFGAFDPNQPRDVQYARAERMRRYLAERVQYAVIAHEMGHSMALRHNFVGSSDAFNYQPQYWQLRTNDGRDASNRCTTLDPAGGCVGPRYLDPLNANERTNLISMFQYSTSMDYPGESSQDMQGLGSYDFAAARMFYGDVVDVYRDDAYRASAPRGVGVLDKMDTFGGITGFAPLLGDGRGGTTSLHYSQLQDKYQLISGCRAVDAAQFKPARWNEETQGRWSPLVDGMIVSVGGQATRCRTQAVERVSWSELRDPTASEGSTYAGHAVDGRTGRVRVPHGFATDTWADLGNLSVFSHDNGADPYELVDFLITQPEVNHIFDNYRRGRQSFSVSEAADRQLERYDAKLRDAAKGLGLMVNVYKDFAQAEGYEFESYWPGVAHDYYPDNLLASGLIFDHFARELARPAAGEHSFGTSNGERILKSNRDHAGEPTSVNLIMPNGATGLFGDVAPGGRPVENALSSNHGEYDSEYTINAGSYYAKAYTSGLMTESVDNFVSDSRRDFVDGRYRAVSVADVFPDGYRRWVANNLTGDDALKGPRVLATSSGLSAQVDAQKYPVRPLGYLQWWRPTPELCFQRATTMECDATPTARTIPVDPQVGWEQQMFLIAWTLYYLPENAQQDWLNLMNIWELGADSDPGFPNRIELHLPSGRTYIAKTFGKETILGKSVQKGIGARILEWGNELLRKAYVVSNGPDLDGDGTPDWYLPVLTRGLPTVQYDSTLQAVDANGDLLTGRPGCDSLDNSTCVCSSNNACMDLQRYAEVPFFMRQAMRDYGLADPSMRGIW